MYTLNCKGRLLVLDKPVVMGIINITPDSFYAGSRQQTVDDVLKKASQMINEGAGILDIGGQSSRPGSELISPDEELQRIAAPIQAIHERFPDIIISIDSFYHQVAREAVSLGASIINDISSGEMDDAMIATVAKLKVPYISMHMQGTPQHMQDNPQYKNVIAEVLDFFIQKKEKLQKAGIVDVIIDPGIGFGKNAQHNFQLIKNLDLFNMIECPILLGVSRKSIIYKTLGISAAESLNGTTVLQTIGLMKGVSILRTHDVKEACEAIKLVQAMNG